MSIHHNAINDQIEYVPIGNRFRGFCPVVVDVETGGFNAQTDALLEVAAIILGIDKDGKLYCKESHQVHVQPFEGANIESASLAVNGIDPYHPLRIALPEKLPSSGRWLQHEVVRVSSEIPNRRLFLGGR